jgi:hypothetical protein
MTQSLGRCPWCGGEGRPLEDAPWDEVGYTCCLNPGCPSVAGNKDKVAQRLPIPLWNLLTEKSNDP